MATVWEHDIFGKVLWNGRTSRSKIMFFIDSTINVVRHIFNIINSEVFLNHNVPDFTFQRDNIPLYTDTMATNFCHHQHIVIMSLLSKLSDLNPVECTRNEFDLFIECL